MFKNFFIILFFISFSLSQNVIEGRWIPGLFSNTMYIFEDGLRYTIYNTDSNFEDLDIEDAIPNPNPYYVEEGTIFIDLFFGNEATYTLGFRCDGNVVDFYYDEDDLGEGLHSTMFREGFEDYSNDCLDPNPDDCLCTEEWDPVCGIDGTTYSNACFATCEYVIIAYDGECLSVDQTIQGRWHLVGFENAVMYQFVDTEPFAEAGLRYTIYANMDGEFDDLDGDYTGGVPNPYIVEDDIITIDFHFGNIIDYHLNFRCDGEVVDLLYDDYVAFTLFREFYDYSQCDSMPDECIDLSEVDFGDCDMVLGVGWNGYQCDYLSGCDWVVDGVDYSDYFYDSWQDCEENCQCEDGEVDNDNPCNPRECWDGQWIEIIIDCAEEMGVPCEDGVYVSPPADECCSTCVLFGDTNYDGILNILDVIMLVDIILEGGQCAEWFECPEDVNQDGTLNVLDIIELVNNILE